MTKLERLVEVAPRFLRSVRVDTDMGNPSALQGFLCTHSFARALQSVASNFAASGHAAFTWTGPYGGGKSVLLLALATLIGPKGRQRTFAEQLIPTSVVNGVLSAFAPGLKGWTTLPVVGARVSIHALVWEAMRNTRLIQSKGATKAPGPREVLEVIKRVAARDSHKGLFLAIDELGKPLESAAINQGDLHFLQELAELASRSDRRLIVVGVLHQAFEEYASRLGKESRDDWAKVQGRFIDIPLSPSQGEQLELLARAIVGRNVPKSFASLAESVANEIAKHRPDTKDLTGALKRVWPLHPVTASLLGPISRRRFGQNQRSIFAFLNSREPAGFFDFLQASAEGDLYRPANLFDYLQFNLEPTILASPDGHRWAIAIDALERAEKRGANVMALVLLKTIALLDLFRDRSGVYASKELLQCILPELSSKQLQHHLDQLRQWSVVVYREHLRAFAIFAGSDFDLEVALEEAREAVGNPDFRLVRQLASLRPIVAKRHYHQTGSLRWFDIDIVPQKDLRSKIDNFHLNGAMGQVLLVVPESTDNDRELRKQIDEVTRAAKHPCLVGISTSASRIRELASELLKLEKIRSTHPQLRDDMVARREVDARTATAAQQLEIEARAAFTSARFIYQGERADIQTFGHLSRFVSDVADQVYSNCPLIVNELLNRSAPSSNAVAAQKSLLRAMLSTPTKPALGFEGFPPERGLYDSILVKSGLHREVDGGFAFLDPDKRDHANIRPLWKALDALLVGARHKPITAADVFALMAAPPFGVRRGLYAILFVAYLQSRLAQYTIYVDGVLEATLNDFTIDRLVMEPKSISVRVFDPNERQKQLIEGIRATVQAIVPSKLLDTNDTTQLARTLVSLVQTQPQYVLRTTQLSGAAAAIRSTLRAATDPNVLVHETLPATLEKLMGSKSTLKGQIEVLRDSLVEIGAAYNQMLSSIDVVLRSEINAESGDTGDVDIRTRADRIKGLTGDLRLEAFITRLQRYTTDRDCIEGIVSLAANKPAKDLSDHEVDAARLEVGVLAQGFNRAEAFARVKGREDGRHAISFVVGLDRSPRVVSRVFDISERDRKLALEIARDITRMGEHTRPEILLAALAQAGSSLIDTVGE